ncbi:hypothetical protein Lfu02_49560 [Longispora fulva]|uniref:Uncharacterized protein n=1 Tax=Longispora fulva TaxID=619741 RepID=A0A8J7GVN3_9ACTN|nr:hypothetical protein [Longispora fulva]MBG6138331.1 hypothetical protein [Longispora fulva]GIG60584.1 hypothetical protein Lfu02_49560 [Longispora fulva]
MTRFWKDKPPGRYRQKGIVVTGTDPLAPAYVGPAAEEVSDLMSELVDWLNAGDPDTGGAICHWGCSCYSVWVGQRQVAAWPVDMIPLGFGAFKRREVI